MFEDYKKNMLGAKSRQSPDIFIANNGLCYINQTEAAQTNSETNSLIDHCFILKNHIFEVEFLESILRVHHFIFVSQSSTKIDHNHKKR